MTYGCFNREPFKETMRVQDGWIWKDNRHTRIPKMVSLKFSMSKKCEYQKDDKYNDQGCVGCKHKEAK